MAHLVAQDMALEVYFKQLVDIWMLDDNTMIAEFPDVVGEVVTFNLSEAERVE